MLSSWFKEIPVVTRTYLTLSVITTTAAAMDLVSPFHLYLNFQLVFRRFELWRLLTTFFYFGSFGLSFMFHMFFLVRYCRLLEESRHFRGRPAEFFWMFVFASIVMLIVGVFFHMHFLGSSLTFMVVYVWSRRHHHIRMSLLGVFPFTAAYLPLVLLGFSVLIHNYFLSDLLGGKRFLQAPSFLHVLFGTHPEILQAHEEPPVE
eukprot:c19819_g1_i1.p1 GENE.c19819_g1_i1~~c19819_g1_i1.p1  ORF type:complete len:204 (-),score=37.29 c19819_g1_i1:104-715(-)